MNVANFRRPYAVLTLDGLDPVDTSISEQALLLDGMNAMGANVQLGGHRVVQMADGVDQSDAVSLQQLDYVSGAVTAAVADLSGQIDAVEVTVGTVQTTLAAVQSTVNSIGLTVFDMNGNNIIEVGVGAAGSTDAANVSQMEAAIAAVVTAYTLADAQVIAAFAAADVNLTSARIAGDALKVNKAGDTMTGSLVINESSLPSLFTMINDNTSTILFRDAALNPKASITYYNVGPLLQFIVNSVLIFGMSSTKCTSYVPLEMSSKKITGLLAGGGGSTDAANVAQVEALNLGTTNAYIAADTLKLSLTGGTMTGTISATTVSTPFNFSNPNGTISAKLSAGTASVTNSCTLQLSSNMDSILEFRDNASNIKAGIKYSYGSPGTLNMAVAGVTALSATNALATFNVPVTLNSGATVGTHAVRYDQTLTLDGTHQMQGDINCGGYKCANMAPAVGGGDAVTKTQMDTKTFLKTSSTSNGSLTIADPLSSLTTVTFRNEYKLLGTNYGTFQMITEALSQLWIKANVDTHVKESGIQLDAGSFTFFTGDPASATTRFTYSTASTEFNIYGTLNMRTNKITGLAAGTAGSSEATTVAQMESADNLRVRLDGSTQMSGNLNMGSYSINNVSNIRSFPATDLVLGRTSTGSEIQIRSGDILVGKTLNMNSSLITNVGTINSSGTTPMYVTNNNVSILQIDSSGLVMSSGKDINMNTNSIHYMKNSSAPDDAVTQNEISQSLIPLTAWRSGETIQTIRKSPAFSQSLSGVVCTAVGGINGGTTPLISTAISITTAGNHVVVTSTFECSSSSGGGDDRFRIVYEYGATPTTVTYNYNLGAPTNFRQRMCTQEYCFLAPNAGSKNVVVRLYNDGDDTMTINNTNWSFVVREIKA